MKIYYAVEIITEKTSENNFAIGLTAGIFRWITDRPGYTGTGTLPKWEDDTDNTYAWYEGFLMKDQMSNPNRSLDISKTGDYGTLSGFSFTIRNDTKIWTYVRDHNIYFTNRQVKLYVVLDDKFYQIWTGVISNNPYNEIEYTFVCIDQFKKIHKMLPPLVIDKNTFPESQAESQGDSIPIVVGNVAYSELKVVTNKPELIDVGLSQVIPGQEYYLKSVAATKYETTGLKNPTLSLYTKGVTFAQDALKYKYIYMTKGGGDANPDQIIKIIGNDATSNDITKVTLETTFEFLTEQIFRNKYSYDPNKSSFFQETTADEYVELYDCTFYESPFLITIQNIKNGSWVKFNNIDFSNYGIGANTMNVLFANFQEGTSGKIEIHLDTHDGTLIGEIPFYHVGIYRRWLEGYITSQLTASQTIVFKFVGNLGSEHINDFYAFKPGHSLSNEETWWFSVINMSTLHLISTNEIKDVVKDSAGIPLLYIYDDQKQEMKQVSNMILNVDYTKDGISGHPEFNLFSSRMQKDGSVRYLTPIVPESWSIEIPYIEVFDYRTLTYYNTNSGYIHAGSTIRLKNLNDKTVRNFPGQDINDRNMWSYTDLTFPDYGKEEIEYQFKVKIVMPKKYIDYDFDTLYAALDMDMLTASKDVRIAIDYVCLDSYGDPIELDSYTTNPVNQENTQDVSSFEGQVHYPVDEQPIAAPFKMNFLPQEYYSNGGVLEVGYDNLWSYAAENADEEVETVRSMLEIPTEITDALKDGTSTNVLQMTVHIYSTVVNDKPQKFSCSVRVKEAGFVGLKDLNPTSDEFYCRLKGELIGTEETNNVYNAFRLMLETYDGIPTANIDYNNLSTTRKNWTVGRTITERKSSFDYLSELASHSFVCIYPDRTGKRALKAWRDDKTPAITLSESDIVRDSIKNWKNTEVSNLFNDFRLWYNYNPASQKFDSSLVVTNADQTVFPEPTEMETYPPTLPLWKRYVGGLQDSYSDSEQMWTVIHESWNRCQAIQPLPADLSNLVWYTNTASFTSQIDKGASVSDSAYKYLKNLLEWTTRQKAMAEFALPITSTNLVLELLDNVNFSDAIFTDDDSRTGWITGVEVDIARDQILLEVTLEPHDLIIDNLIIEDGQLITIGTVPETGIRPDQVDDGQGRTF